MAASTSKMNASTKQDELDKAQRAVSREEYFLAKLLGILSGIVDEDFDSFVDELRKQHKETKVEELQNLMDQDEDTPTTKEARHNKEVRDMAAAESRWWKNYKQLLSAEDTFDAELHKKADASFVENATAVEISSTVKKNSSLKIESSSGKLVYEDTEKTDDTGLVDINHIQITIVEKANSDLPALTDSGRLVTGVDSDKSGKNDESSDVEVQVDDCQFRSSQQTCSGAPSSNAGVTKIKGLPHNNVEDDPIVVIGPSDTSKDEQDIGNLKTKGKDKVKSAKKTAKVKDKVKTAKKTVKADKKEKHLKDKKVKKTKSRRGLFSLFCCCFRKQENDHLNKGTKE